MLSPPAPYHYILSLDDHLAWYDYFINQIRPPRWHKFPLIGSMIAAHRRKRFLQGILSDGNRSALGERTVELTSSGVRESSSQCDFSTAWDDVELAVVNREYVFLIHPSMNAHVIPLRSFGNAELRDSFIHFAVSYAPKSTNKLSEDFKLNSSVKARKEAALA